MQEFRADLGAVRGGGIRLLRGSDADAARIAYVIGCGSMNGTLNNPEAAELARRLALAPHPEGGWYRETHRSPQIVRSPEHGERAAFTSILFLLEAPDVSRLHRLDAEELWNWHAGSPLDVHVLSKAGARQVHRLGTAPGEELQIVVPAGCWFGAELAAPGSWSLVGCVVSPGFDYAKFELADRDELLREYPAEREAILRLT